jgi:protocatechuate 3,4-dioxygenase beta subunit
MQNLQLFLARYAHLRGRVVDGRHVPLAGASVRVQAVSDQPWPKDLRGHVATDGQGLFAIDVPPGRVVLTAEATGHGASSSPPLYVKSGAQLAGLQLVLGGGLSLSGIVMGPERERIVGARVWIEDELGRRRIGCDGEGRFVAGGLNAGKKLLQAEAANFSPSRVQVVEVSSSTRDSTVTIHLAKAHGLSGQVADAEGRGVAGATVELRPGTPTQRPKNLIRPPQVKTDGHGRFSFSTVFDLPLVVTARGPGNTVAMRSGVRPGTQDLVLRLQGSGGIVGRVTRGDNGEPINHFAVVAQPSGIRGVLAQRAEVLSASGDFQLEHLVPGRYSVIVSVHGSAPTEVGAVGVVAGADVRVDVSINSGGSIEGVVVDQRGSGVPGAAVTLETGWAGDRVISDSWGKFRIPDVARGRRSLTVKHGDYDTQMLTGIAVHPVQETPVRVELRRRQGPRAAVRFAGIGVIISQRDGKLWVMQTLAGSPAALAGVRVGDQIIAVDGRALREMTMASAIETMRGVEGTPVRLQLGRGEQEVAIDILRAEVTIAPKK